MTPHQKGLLLTGVGGLLLSFDIPVLRLAGGDIWSVNFVRYGLGLCVMALIWLGLSAWRRRAVVLLPGRTGLVAAMLYGCSALAFIEAVFNTTTANVVFILSFSTMFAALLGWVVMGERPAGPTLLTMAVMVGAVGLIVGDSVRTGNYFGDLLALLTSFVLASVITLSRWSGRDMGFAPMSGGILPVLVAVAMLWRMDATPTFVAPEWIVFSGALLIPLSFWLLATGPKYISGAEVAMFYLLETVLAPIWVWVLFDETPSRAALAGGTIIIVALGAHSAWQFRRQSVLKTG